MTPSAASLHKWVLSSWMLLFLWVAGHQLRNGMQLHFWLWALVYSIPLLICLPGLWQAKRRTRQWATLCVLPYFIVGVTEGIANPQNRVWALTMLGLSLLWFFALVAALRGANNTAPSA